MFACSSTGEKLKPLVIGKFENQRCFKCVKKDKLPVNYETNSKAWINCSIFTNWIKDVNKQNRREGIKILMIFYNATSHNKIELSNVKLTFLPANTTSVLQPLDQGIIRTLKGRYRKCLLRNLLTKIDSADSASTLCKNDSIHWIS